MAETPEPNHAQTIVATASSPRVVVPHQPGSRQRAGALLLVLSLKTLASTVRFRIHDQSGFFETPPAGQAIYACWHNRLALCLDAYFDYAGPRVNTRGLAAMVSASRDGAFLSAVLEGFRVQPVRGSSSRRGRQALLEMTRWAERGYDLAITPDGPRGPRYKVQPGIISLAQITGLPIIPFSNRLNWKLQIRSWDRFQIPLPFACCKVQARPPLRVPREADEAERERLRLQLEQTMMSITED
jgi:lysophospholipid acyltransferase (LPLAT)-like uncharacterized protein